MSRWLLFFLNMPQCFANYNNFFAIFLSIDSYVFIIEHEQNKLVLVITCYSNYKRLYSYQPQNFLLEFNETKKKRLVMLQRNRKALYPEDFPMSENVQLIKL